MRILALLTLSMLAGCSLIQDLLPPETTEKAAKVVGERVTDYCEKVDEPGRERFEPLVNENAAPNSIAVTCAGDVTAID